MTAQMLAYPFLFLALFFQTFTLVTFLSKPAREARRRVTGRTEPTVAIIVPCWNEGETVAATTDSLLALDYPKSKLEIILVDNASSDNTPEVMERYRSNPQVRIIHEARRGKYIAVNSGIAATSAEIIGCLDADSFVEPDALRESVAGFTSPDIAAVTAAMSVHKPKNLLQHMQNAEYILGIVRQNALAIVHGIHVTPGPFSLYRRDIILAVGGFRSGYQTEDLEMALRLQKNGYHIANAAGARVYTKAPSTLSALVKQRTRWTSGYLRNIINEYGGMIGNSKYGALGLITLPIGTLTIGSGILIFAVVIYELVKRLVHFVLVRVGVPLGYTLAVHNFDWFYFPTTVYTLLGLLAICSALLMVAAGKHISKTPGSLGLGFVGYVLLYGFVAPLWLIRSSVDVAFGKRRGWR